MEYAIEYFNVANSITGFYIAQNILLSLALLNQKSLVKFVRKRRIFCIIISICIAGLYALYVHFCGVYELSILREAKDSYSLIIFSESAIVSRQILIFLVSVIFITLLTGVGRKKKPNA